MILTYYHTQDNRGEKLESPIICTKDNAWLGEAYYFWENEEDADFWGIKVKNKTGKYDIYTAEIPLDNVLDTVFNREHYYFWVKQIEKAAKNFVKKTGSKPTLKEINDFFKEKESGLILMEYYFKIFLEILFIIWLRIFNIKKESN